MPSSSYSVYSPSAEVRGHGLLLGPQALGGVLDCLLTLGKAEARQQRRPCRFEIKRGGRNRRLSLVPAAAEVGHLGHRKRDPIGVSCARCGVGQAFAGHGERLLGPTGVTE